MKHELLGYICQQQERISLEFTEINHVLIHVSFISSLNKLRQLGAVHLVSKQHKKSKICLQLSASLFVRRGETFRSGMSMKRIAFIGAQFRVSFYIQRSQTEIIGPQALNEEENYMNIRVAFTFQILKILITQPCVKQC